MPPVNSRKRDQTLHTTSDGMVLVITRDHDKVDLHRADHRSADCHASGHDTVDHGLSDHDLLLRMLAGDEPAFTALYRRRQGAVYRFALQMTGSVVIAEDVTQEVFMALLWKTARYDAARGPLARFLYAVHRYLLLRRIE